ncbi:MAG: hypothetical protein HY298_10415 [Verrucomicrobia bacterium]|nr:hypothetical protein [Verrucomicrobiota bacterium]
MSASSLEVIPETVRWEPKFPFHLVVAYEDELTHGRAIALYDTLVKNLRDDHDMRYSWWKFHFLYDPALLDRAIAAAMEADMIIVALRDAKEPPWIARNWIEKWRAAKEGHDSALVALVEGTPSDRVEDCLMFGYLNGVALQAEMNFFPHVFPAAPSHVLLPLAGISAHATDVTPLVEDRLRSPTNAPLWGINEY